MITNPVTGEEWGTAFEIAAALGADITPKMIRNWATRDGLPAARLTGPGRGAVYYPLPAAEEIEQRKRSSRRGRPRTVRAA
ncbi:hypothetical protein Ait01nite_030290 [Actinoplanes italicus]|uniref:MerR-like DNA binding protein n=1 Tax=Actinoplanes italicus TaxID=113567 RepID=A0A2T0KJI9_9ACTN|nr:hypothetical protein [Actinoplanes italicus]PRX23486.1 hypothetical protein CLV67_103234 [Actinoplanes italicus]GIE29984.1 hypothetical protein Ait01nite_030290 [Actinoplanes italicus]